MAESDLLATQDINSVISTDSAEDAVNDKKQNTSETQALEDVVATNEAEEANSGNPVFTTTTTQVYGKHSIYSGESKPLPERFDNPGMISGYGKTKRNSHPLYQTSSSDFGAIAPSIHTSHTEYHGRSQGFSNHLGAAGMPCNRSLNTSMTKSRVHSSLDN